MEQENEDPIVKVDLKENRKPLELGAVPISCTVSVYFLRYTYFNICNTGIPRLVRFFGPKQTALLEKPH